MNSSRFNQTGPKIGLSVRLAETQAEIEAAQRLRYRVFAEELGADIPNTDGRDIDPYDEHCHHLLAFDDATGEVIGCYRLITEETAKKVGGKPSNSAAPAPTPTTATAASSCSCGRAWSNS